MTPLRLSPPCSQLRPGQSSPWQPSRAVFLPSHPSFLRRSCPLLRCRPLAAAPRAGLLPSAQTDPARAPGLERAEPTEVAEAAFWEAPPLRDLPGTATIPGEAAVSRKQGVRGGDALAELKGGAWGSGAAVGVAGLAAFLPGLDLSGPGSVVEAMAVLAIIVAVHEAGHFFAARSLGIHVAKFSIGFGPTIFKYQAKVAAPPAPPPPPEAPKPRFLAGALNWLSSQKRSSKQAAVPVEAPEQLGVEYSLRLIPLGGYVAFPDDDEKNTQYAKDDPDLLQNRPVLDRIIVVSAGVIANLLFAYALLFTQVNTVGLLRQEFQPGVVVPLVIAGGAGEKAGLQSGDIILEVQGQKLSASGYSVNELVTIIKERPSQPVKLLVERDHELRTLTVRPSSAADGTGRINVQLTPNLETLPVYPRSLVEANRFATDEVLRLGSLVVDGLRQLFLNFGEAAERLSGPVAIVAVGAEVARTSAPALFQFAAIVNLNLAVVNILPLPALDGGFLALLLLEAARGGKKLPQDVERAIMSSGLLLLLTAGVFLIVRDTLNLANFPL